MPYQILNVELYADRTVQDWHRSTFPRTYMAIDLDLMGACHICRTPLYLVESTTNPNKPTTILRSLSQLSRVPALVIEHDTHHITGGRVVHPGNARLQDESQVRECIDALRIAHHYGYHAPRGGV